MHSEEFRKAVVRLSKPLDKFLLEQIVFLAKAGIENPSADILVTSIRLFHNLTELGQNDISLDVEGVRTCSAFCVSDELAQVMESRRTHVYEVQIPVYLDEEIEFLLEATPCETDEDVIIVSLCCFKWLLDFIQHQENIFVRYDHDGETRQDVYRVPLLEVYKPIFFH